MSNTANSTSISSPIHKQAQPPVPLRLNRSLAMNVVELHKSYTRARHQIPVLKGIDLEFGEGEFTAIIGQSGSGKSTLLHLLGTLDAPDSGEIWMGDERIDNLRAKRKEQLRNQQFGMIFQFYHLLPELSMLENVLIPRMIQDGIFSYWRNKKRYKERALKLLEIVGLADRIHHRPSQLSGGEMQRTAIARALISEPTILLADEPTGNLDSENGGEVMKTLMSLQREENLTIIMVTHDEAIAEQADRTVRIVDGIVQ